MRNVMLVEVEIWTVAKTEKGTAVLIKPIDSDRVVPIAIGQLEAHSILIGMGNVPMPRPLSHELMVQLIEKLHAQVERVEIHDVQEGTFFARIILKQGVKKIVLDARPSDALGVSTRLKCQVFMAEYIIDECSVPMSMISEEAEMDSQAQPAGEEKPRTIDTPLDIQYSILKMQLDKAVVDENYEEAAKLRDQIARFKDF